MAGLALVLVHGTTAKHSRWETVLPLLEPHATVYAMDRRGRGASTATAHVLASVQWDRQFAP